MTPQPPASGSESHPFRYVVSSGFPALLDALGSTLAVTTYQAGKLVLFRARGGRISALFRTFNAAMGLAFAPGRLAIGTRNAIWLLRDAPEIGLQLGSGSPLHDACFVPRSSHVTGDVRVHEMAWCRGSAETQGEPKENLWFVNTRFSCLCTLHADYSFVPQWKPPFVSLLAAEDRCHLNGLAMANGRPRFVTALGVSDVPEGWRAAKASGGILLDVRSGEAVSTGLAMPHSPRLLGGKLFVLNSGYGALETVDIPTGKRVVLTRVPSYTRGLAIAGKYAFVGMSKIREKREFGGLPIESKRELKAGVVAVNLETGNPEESIEFESGCEEIFDVQVLPALRYPALVGLEKQTVDGVFIVPPGCP